MQGTLQTLHFAAVGAWVGGLTWLVVGVRRGAEPVRVRRYSTIAATGLGVLVVTGILRASNELGGFDLVAPPVRDQLRDGARREARDRRPALVALGAVNRYRNVRRYEELGRAPLLRTVGGELVLAAGVLAVTGVLTGLAPQGAATAPRPAGRAAARR